MLKENSIILFQGDSITDAGRTYDTPNAAQAAEPIGSGYPYMIKQYLDTFYGDSGIRVINRGVSGNRVIDLKNRWTEDCIELKPDYLSILIGVNDTWRRYDSNDATSAEAFEDSYRFILQRAASELSCQLILLEPFLIPSDPEKEVWREDLDPKIHAVRRLAREFGAVYIPLDGVFAANCTGNSPEKFSLDGVHPTAMGHALISKLWLDIME